MKRKRWAGEIDTTCPHCLMWFEILERDAVAAAIYGVRVVTCPHCEKQFLLVDTGDGDGGARPNLEIVP
jgi:hypothetical protein